MTSWRTICCLVLLCIVHSSYSEETVECDIKKLEMLVREVDSTIDRLKLQDKEEDLQKAIAAANEKLSTTYNLLHGLPEECKKVSQLLTEFVQDYELLLQCPTAHPIEKFLNGYDPKDISFFANKLNTASDVTLLSKQADVYKSLARLSFLSDIETNEKFYKQVKELLTGAEPEVHCVLIRTLEVIAAKTFRISDQSKTHPELLIDLYESNKTAGVRASELIAADQCGKFSSKSLEFIAQIPDLNLRAHAFASLYNTPGIPKSGNEFFFIIPHLQELLNADGFERLDEDLKQEVQKHYDETNEEGKKFMNAGEVCLLHNPNNSSIKEHSVYVKRNNDGELSNDWSFKENAEGGTDRNPFYSDPVSEQIFYPRGCLIGGFWGSEPVIGEWKSFEGGFDCSFNPETHNTYICYNVGKITLRPSLIDSTLERDHDKIKEYNLRRKETCNH